MVLAATNLLKTQEHIALGTAQRVVQHHGQHTAARSGSVSPARDGLWLRLLEEKMGIAEGQTRETLTPGRLLTFRS